MTDSTFLMFLFFLFGRKARELPQRFLWHFNLEGWVVLGQVHFALKVIIDLVLLVIIRLLGRTVFLCSLICVMISLFAVGIFWCRAPESHCLRPLLPDLYMVLWPIFRLHRNVVLSFLAGDWFTHPLHHFTNAFCWHFVESRSTRQTHVESRVVVEEARRVFLDERLREELLASAEVTRSRNVDLWAAVWVDVTYVSPRQAFVWNGESSHIRKGCKTGMYNWLTEQMEVFTLSWRKRGGGGGGGRFSKVGSSAHGFFCVGKSCRASTRSSLSRYVLVVLESKCICTPVYLLPRSFQNTMSVLIWFSIATHNIRSDQWRKHLNHLLLPWKEKVTFYFPCWASQNVTSGLGCVVCHVHPLQFYHALVSLSCQHGRHPDYRRSNNSHNKYPKGLSFLWLLDVQITQKGDVICWRLLKKLMRSVGHCACKNKHQ